MDIQKKCDELLLTPIKCKISINDIEEEFYSEPTNLVKNKFLDADFIIRALITLELKDKLNFENKNVYENMKNYQQLVLELQKKLQQCTMES